MSFQRLISRLAAVCTLGLSTRPSVRLSLRRGLHRILCCALRWRSRPFPVGRAGPMLVLAPHQDDEALGCGGLLLRQRRAGVEIEIVYITDGGASHPGHPTLSPETLVLQRQAEARAAMHRIGVDSARLEFLGVPDGTLAHLEPGAAAVLSARLAALFRRKRPAEIFLPCRRDGSSEHDAAFALARSALIETGLTARVFEFPVWSWWNPLLLVRPLCTSRRVWRVTYHGDERAKREALAAYPSQTEATPPWTAPILSPEFVSFFSSSEEFFFES
ncbi:MAG TPA: PIG-L family deacetylase [Opitutaceae bacterium]|nr:PIG-L family deacetylase [Opitutaceae bacterium]